jgi:hypothetical protein
MDIVYQQRGQQVVQTTVDLLHVPGGQPCFDSCRYASDHKVKAQGLLQAFEFTGSQLLYAVLIPDGTRNSTVTYCGEKLSEPKPLEN